ncbi:hypothetical protein HUZ36_14250 [Pseudoalteromonas sp. McH1-7]|uniref:Uncharacterized protein n=1 Tax=Pseudoalteromonas peptidolytica F12-50-A1 TaxID=1315280 RepID=A0A8I0T5Y9_9GAMM|nr:MULTISPECIES: hypothetical protein [Pseudoalteromonas]MBE0347897.1 hypothetical protein [Pseudoalteromonas peptidolytica F12-50-A1]MDW7551331.1 hypothetical protein [Pseudoalteromonas peptidolytica]NLR15303.1 hypothetical protein [Pseudoalteromonas peptidolytica]NUZ11946.1 hypothetical protein [Pseudoalteromonas sp. McH1-7]RRS09136.1 hypothetical protein EAG18_08425 [Pseudoalteromonas sp. J010]
MNEQFEPLMKHGSIYAKVMADSIQATLLQVAKQELATAEAEQVIGELTAPSLCRDLVEKEHRLAISEELTALREIAMLLLIYIEEQAI